MSAKPKSKNDIEEIISSISFLDRKFRLITKGTDGVGNDYFLLQVQYYEADIDNPELIELQSARKWYISPYATETEIVDTAFAACQRSMEHVLKEHFLYKGKRVYSPHFDIKARLVLCEEKAFDKR